MLHELPDHPTTKAVLSEMSEVLGYEVRELDSETALRSSVSTQLALLASGVASARILMDNGLEFTAVAGLSVGAYAAAVAAEAVSLADATRLVRSRADQMERMYPTGYGLAALVGLNERQVTKLVEGVYSDAEPVFVANINAPLQIVIAGSISAMKKVLLLATSQGARKAELLDVRVPSHCPLLEPVARSLRIQMETIRVSAPKIVYIANVNARAIHSAEGIKRDLADNIAHGVRWYDATTVAHELGCTLFLEVPPGHVLTDLVLDSLRDVQAYPVTPERIGRVLSSLSRKEM
jgi:malonate decarboxylase epsilon subunit